MTESPPLRLTVQRGPQVGQTFTISQPTTTIGRTSANDIVIRATTVSRQHARILLEDGRYTIEDLGSANGTFVNNQRLTEPRELRVGDLVRLGEHIELEVAPATVPTAVRAATVVADDLTEALTPPVAPTVDAADLAEKALAPQLLIQISGEAANTFELQATTISLGRAVDNAIQIEIPYVSRYQARLEHTDMGYRLEPASEATNPLVFNGRPVADAVDLTHGDVLRLVGANPGEMTTLTYFDWARAAEAVTPTETLRFDEGTVIAIGRAPDNDLVADNPLVSRYHAQVERIGARFRVRDLKSVNGTFVNEEPISGEVWLNPEDVIRVGNLRLTVGEDSLQHVDESGGMLVELRHINKWVRPDLNLLQDLSLYIRPREFVVLVGLSGAGKSTLMDAIAGYRPATDGEVLVNNVNLYDHFNAVRDYIGYVPQREIIHMELPVFKALDYSAQLRMPPDTTTEERHQRVDEVLEDLGLGFRRDVQVSALSGGQQKRVSIGVELITRPSLFFLDEPTSGLDPGTETVLMQLMRSLADQGRTIILITHATKNVMLADKVIFLVRGGRLAWYGPPDEALTYFDGYRTERARRSEDMSFDQIYGILEDASLGTPEEWGERFRNHQAFQRYISGPLELDGDGATAAAAPAAPRAPAAAPPAPALRKQVPGWRQFLILTARNFNILVRDKFSLALMLVTAPLLGSLDFIMTRRNMFHPEQGDPTQVFLTLFILTIIALFVGAMSQMREIVKEAEIYKRERLVNLQLLPYVLSKILFAALLALYQSAAYLTIRYVAVDMPGTLGVALSIYTTLALATMAGMMIGLFVSAVSPNQATAPLLTILILIPQIVFGGGILPIESFGPVGEVISYAMPARWAYEALVTQTGAGVDVARDVCWQLPETERQALSAEQKAEQCTCLGENIFDDCYFPGLQSYYAAALDEPEPIAPTEPESPGAPPPEPEFPPKPEMPPEPDMPPDPEMPPEPERPDAPELSLPAPPEPPEQPEVFTPLNQLMYNIALKEWTEELDAYNKEVNATLQEHNDTYTANVEGYLDALQAYQEEAQAIQEAHLEEVQEIQRTYSEEVEEIQRAYDEEVTAIQEDYSAEITAYQAQIDTFEIRQEQYRADVEDYQERIASWQSDRSGAIAEAEGIIASFWESHGSNFDVDVTSRWLAQGAIILALFGLILIFQKRKDVI